MVDDILCVSECGISSVILNSYIKAKINIKKLQYGVEKFHKMHVDKKTAVCSELYIDEWEIKEVKDIETGRVDIKDKYKEKVVLDESDSEKYLVDFLSTNGSNTKNIEASTNRGPWNC